MVGVPRVPREHVSRPRLLNRLDAATPLTVLRAPSGSGKSSLLAEWARQDVAVDGVWLNLTRADQCRETFWATVATEVVAAGLAGSDSLLAGVPWALQRAADAQRLLVRAVNQLGTPLMLVLDNFERVADPQVGQDICAVVRHCEHLSVVLATRTRSAVEDDAVGLLVDRTVIAAEELAFTEPEIAQVLAAALDSDDIPGDVARRIRDRTGGRPLLVRALLMEARARSRPLTELRHVDQLSGTILSDGITRLLDTAADLRSFLLRTSVADVVTPDLAAQLAGTPDVAAHMEEAETLGLAVWLDDSHERGLRYHPLTAHLLREQAAQRIPRELPDLHARVTRWELAHGSSLAAFRHALLAGDDGLASRVAMLRWNDLLRYRDSEVKKLLLGIPLARMRHHPFLAAVLALALNVDRWEQVRAAQYFGLALWGVRHRRPRADTEERLILDVLESVALRLTGSSRGMARTRAAAQALRQPTDGLSQLGSQLTLLHNQTAISLFRLGLVDEALATLDIALARRDRENQQGLRHAKALRAGVLAHLGAMKASQEMLDRAAALDLAEDTRDGYFSAMLHYAAAWERIEAFDHAGAQEHIDVMQPHLDTIEYQPYFVALQAFTDALREAAEPALVSLREHIETERVAHRSLRAERDMVKIAGAMLHHFAGRTGAAQKVLDSIHRTAGSEMVRAAVCLAAGAPDQALERLAASRRAGNVAPRVAAASDLILAAASLRLGQEPAALGAASRMAATMEHHGLRAHLVLVPRRDLIAIRDLLDGQRPDVLASIGNLDEVSDLVRTRTTAQPLSRRERLVLRELLQTPSRAEIAEALGVSPNTVKTQLKTVYRKLGVGSREEALAVALEEEILDEGE